MPSTAISSEGKVTMFGNISRVAWPVPLFVLLACTTTEDESDIGADDGLPLVTVVSTDSGLEGPDTIAAGPTEFRLVNQSEEGHAATILRFEDGHTFGEWLEAYAEANRTGGARPEWATFHGGPAYLGAGQAEAIVDLEPGNYAWACFSPDEDGVLHVLSRGEATAFTVRPGTDDPAPPAPDPTVTLRMLDYAYELSAPIDPGDNVVRVVNDGADPHHVLIFSLLPGRTMEDYNDWLANGMEGEEPAEFVGAMGEMSTGTEAFLELDLSAGDYVLVCLVAGQDEVPHVAKGMIQHVRVG